MPPDEFKPYPKKHEEREEHKKLHPHGPHPELPPHLLKELFDMKEKIGKLEGQVDVLLRTVLKK
jgi:hypothetical protein